VIKKGITSCHEMSHGEGGSKIGQKSVKQLRTIRMAHNRTIAVEICQIILKVINV
jgi:hypothetical protein